MKTTIEVKKAQYIKQGTEALDLAVQYLHEHADEWSSSHEEHWRNLVHQAEVFAIKAMALDELK